MTTEAEVMRGAKFIATVAFLIIAMITIASTDCPVHWISVAIRWPDIAFIASVDPFIYYSLQILTSRPSLLDCSVHCLAAVKSLLTGI